MILTPPINEDDHVRGARNASVSLVEYGDYECPSCGRACPIVDEVLELMRGRVQFAFRHFPLVTMHPHALHAAEAAESAADEGKFWRLHSVLFENQDDLADESIAGYAEEIGLHPEQLFENIANQTRIDKIRSHIESGIESGVRGTPTFFINGHRYQGSWSLRDLLAALRDAGAGAHASR